MDDASSRPILPQGRPAELFAGPQPLAEPERRAIADAALSWLKAEYGPDLVAVALFGSTATKRDGPYSDVEVWAAIEDGAGERPSLRWVWGPGQLEIALMSVSRVLSEALEVTSRWPLTHGKYIHAAALYEAGRQGGFVARVQEAAGDIPGAARRAAMGACVLELYDLVGKLRNSRTGGPSDVARLACEFGLSLSCLMALQHRYVFVSGRRIFAEAHRLEGPAGGRAFLTRVAHGLLAPPAEIIDQADQLWAALPAWLESVQLGVDELVRAAPGPAEATSR